MSEDTVTKTRKFELFSTNNHYSYSTGGSRITNIDTLKDQNINPGFLEIYLPKLINVNNLPKREVFKDTSFILHPKKYDFVDSASIYYRCNSLKSVYYSIIYYDNKQQFRYIKHHVEYSDTTTIVKFNTYIKNKFIKKQNHNKKSNSELSSQDSIDFINSVELCYLNKKNVLDSNLFIFSYDKCLACHSLIESLNIKDKDRDKVFIVNNNNATEKHEVKINDLSSLKDTAISCWFPKSYPTTILTYENEIINIWVGYSKEVTSKLNSLLKLLRD